MSIEMTDINIEDYDYDLPAERIAQYPVNERDMSQLLIFRGGNISKDIFRNIDNYISKNSLLVFNNTRVIRARIIFQKMTGASVEIFCLEPLSPFNYELSLSSTEAVEWKCIIGNLKKWKSGKISTPFIYQEKKYELTAERFEALGDAWRIRFSWNCPVASFSEIIEEAGHIPLPPYINRKDEEDDIDRYQTVYSRINGSVAAPTAGLHFTNNIFDKLREKGIRSTEVTLHVGAGTFKPVKSNMISGHDMHCEHIFVTAKTIELLLSNQGNIITVGTTSVRTLESLYWLGVKILRNPTGFSSDLSLSQWEPYDSESKVTVAESLAALMDHIKDRNLPYLHASTSIIIIPGYQFRMVNGIITNFHQPGSTLLLLVSAWIGKEWKKVYKFALENDFRFLSYGDCSLLIR